MPAFISQITDSVNRFAEAIADTVDNPRKTARCEDPAAENHGSPTAAPEK
jgi:hypothetical protein